MSQSDFPRLVNDAAAESLRLQAQVREAATLNFGGVSGTTGSMDALVDAKIAAAEARTDAKFSAVLAKLDSLTFEVRSTRSSIWTAAFAIMGLMIAVLAIIITLVPAAFSTGTQIRDIAREEARLAQPAIAVKPTAPAIAPATAPAR